jgi:hypothetical protein
MSGGTNFGCGMSDCANSDPTEMQRSTAKIVETNFIWDLLMWNKN